MTDKLTRAQREKIIFQHLKGIDDPLYEVLQTKHGKYIVRPKAIQLEEEESMKESPEVQPVVKAPVKQPEPKPTNDKLEAKREKRKRNRHAKQDAKRILDALNNLISSNSVASDESNDEEPINDQQQQYPVPVRYQRRVLRFN